MDAALKARARSVRREYVRSLLYSPTVLLNRAFALNEPAVYRDVEKHPKTVAEMIASGRIVVLIMQNEGGLADLVDSGSFPISDDGRRAWRGYLQKFGDSEPRYLQLSKTHGRAVVSRFPEFMRALIRQEMHPEDFTALRVAVGIGDDRVDEFRTFLEKQGRPWLDSRGDSLDKLVRTAVYENFILPPGADASKPAIDRDKPFAMELKLLVDLAYNHNLPTTLSRQSFIPTAMPSPLCLPAHMFHPGSETVELNNARLAEALAERAFSDAWIYVSQEAYLVPDWAELSIEDVSHIQRWPEWAIFRAAQERLVRVGSEAEFEAGLQDFFDALRHFQERLSRDVSDDHGALGHLVKGARLLKLFVSPVLTWAGESVNPTRAEELLIKFAAVSIDYALDVVIDFVEAQADARHAADEGRFVYRTAGVRRTVQANIRETAAHRRLLERRAERTAPPVVPTSLAQTV